jgi:hypothetical protein
MRNNLIVTFDKKRHNMLSEDTYTKHHQDARAPQLGGYLASKASQKLALTPRC